MDGVNSVNQSVEMLNQILKMISSEQVDMAKKLIKVSAEMSMPPIAGKGEQIDVVG